MRQLAIFGLTITSSWGNGHATTYRSLLAGLNTRGWRVVFYEREMAWYRANRDLDACPYAQVRLYSDWASVRLEALGTAAASDAVIVGSYCPEGARITEGLFGQRRTGGPLVVFYDIDTPVTLEYLRGAGCDYLHADQIPRFDLYLSFTAGPMLRHLEQQWGARRARPLHCCCDPRVYVPAEAEKRWDLGYMGTYAADRQAKLEAMLLEPARRMPDRHFIIAGPMYPPQAWPGNVTRQEHIAPGGHAAFYRACRFCLNLTRQPMADWGYSPSIRLFEAAGCGTPIISDSWPGSEEFFRSSREMLTACGADEMVKLLTRTTGDAAARIGAAARQRVLAEHSGIRRAAQLEACLDECRGARTTTPNSLATAPVPPPSA